MRSPLKPHITEKTYQGYGDVAKKEAATYTFLARTEIDKDIAKKLIEKEYSVSVEDVRVINLPSKVRKFKGHVGKTSPRHKIVVKLKAGERIAAFEVESKDEKKESKGE